MEILSKKIFAWVLCKSCQDEIAAPPQSFLIQRRGKEETAEIYSPVQEAISELRRINYTVLIALGIGLSAMLVVLLTFMYFLINSIMKVFHDIEGNVEQLLRNVGQSDKSLGENMVEIDSGASSELTQLSNSMNEMIRNLQANRNQAQSVDVSAGEQITLDRMWNLVPMGQSVQEGARSLPVATAIESPSDAAVAMATLYQHEEPSAPSL